MQIEACLIADSASEYQGKLCVLGAFDRIGAPQAPVVHPHCAVVLRVRFERSEEGKHPFRLMLIDQDGRSVGVEIRGDINVVIPPESDSGAMNLIPNLNGLQIPRFGTYHFDFTIDGSIKARIPLHVVQVGQMRQAA